MSRGGWDAQSPERLRMSREGAELFPAGDGETRKACMPENDTIRL